MQAFWSSVGDHHELTHLHARLAVTCDNVRLHHNRLAEAEGFSRDRTCRAALAAENWGEVTAAITVQQIVNDREPGSFYDPGGLNDLDGSSAGSQHPADRDEGGVRRMMQVAVQRIRLQPHSEAAQDLTGVLP